jgi:hypothetical protein
MIKLFSQIFNPTSSFDRTVGECIGTLKKVNKTKHAVIIDKVFSKIRAAEGLDRSLLANYLEEPLKLAIEKIPNTSVRTRYFEKLNQTVGVKITQLPLEILHYIFSFLTFDEAFKAFKVSKQWLASLKATHKKTFSEKKFDYLDKLKDQNYGSFEVYLDENHLLKIGIYTINKIKTDIFLPNIFKLADQVYEIDSQSYEDKLHADQNECLLQLNNTNITQNKRTILNSKIEKIGRELWLLDIKQSKLTRSRFH